MAGLASIFPVVLVCGTVCFCAWVALDLGRRAITAWDKTCTTNERIDAIHAESKKLLNAALTGFVEDLKAAADRLDRLEAGAAGRDFRALRPGR